MFVHGENCDCNYESDLDRSADHPGGDELDQLKEWEIEQ
jgi:hypothetical protein